MKRLFLSVILIMGFLAIGTAYAASGYKMTLDYEGVTMGLLIYYDDSVSEYVADFNDAFDTLPLYMDYDINIYNYGAISANQVLQIANDVINHGSTYYNWDYCLGALMYKSTAYNSTTIKCDVFLLGLTYGGLSIPFMYIGSFEVNEMLQSMDIGF